MPQCQETTQADWPTVQEVVDRHIRETIAREGGNITKAAQLLGIDRRTVYRKLGRMRAREAA